MLHSHFIPYAKQSITQEDIDQVSAALRSDTITRGPLVEAFEEALADYCGAKFGIAFSNASTALMAACHAAKTGPYDRLITTPNSFIASTGAGVQYQATPVFIDIDRETGNLDLEQLSQNLDYPSTRGKNIILPVHFAGIPVDMESLGKMIKDPNTVVIEDAAHALGSIYSNGNKVGCCDNSDMTIFSFHPAKNMTTGEGGMVMTNNSELAYRLKRFRNNGIEKAPELLQEQNAYPGYYEVLDITSNYNFTDMQAALGLSQLKRLDEMVIKRRKLVKAYRERLHGLVGIRLFNEIYDENTAYHLFVVQIDFPRFGITRAEVMNSLRENNIGTQVHYIPIYRHPAIQSKCGDIKEYFPNMEEYFAEALSLPLYYDLNIEDIDRIAEAFKKAIRYPYLTL